MNFQIQVSNLDHINKNLLQNGSLLVIDCVVTPINGLFKWVTGVITPSSGRGPLCKGILPPKTTSSPLRIGPRSNQKFHVPTIDLFQGYVGFREGIFQELGGKMVSSYKVGPLPVISMVITPVIGVLTPVTQL